MGRGRARMPRGRRPISISGRPACRGTRPRRARRTKELAERTGRPVPLLFHLASATSILREGLVLSPGAALEGFPWAPHLAHDGRALGVPDRMALAEEAARRLREMLAGIERWQRHPHRRALTRPGLLWQEGASRLLGFGGRGPAVLAVPSLINRAYVLDLGMGTSLMRHLAARGLRPMLLDWGVPGPAEAGFDLGAWHDLRLVPALERAAAEGPVALLGYCMGGTLAAALAQTRPDLVSRLALIGAPWSFAGGAGIAHALRALGRSAGPDRLAETLMALDAAFGAVPAELLQLLFAALDPGLALAKFRRFATMPEGSAEMRRFVELEDWLNDPVPLTGPAAVEILIDWQLRDLTGRDLWRVSGERIRPGTLRLPTIAFCSTRDRIAPSASTEPLAGAIPGARLVRPDTGHVGMIVGGRARAQVWEPLAEFLAAGED